MRELKIVYFDGAAANSRAGFYEEVERNFASNLSWKIGRNLNAFNDVLRGGFTFHDYDEKVVIHWQSCAKSIRGLDGKSMVAEYEEFFNLSTPLDRTAILALLKKGNRCKGGAFFPMVCELIVENGHDLYLHR